MIQESVSSGKCLFDSNYFFSELFQLIKVDLKCTGTGGAIDLRDLEYQCGIGSLEVFRLVSGEIMCELDVEGDELLQSNLIEECFQAILRLIVIQYLEFTLQLSNNGRDHLLFERAPFCEDCLKLP